MAKRDVLREIIAKKQERLILAKAQLSEEQIKYLESHSVDISEVSAEVGAAEAEEKDDISPLVKSLSGVIQLPQDSNSKEYLHKHLNEKYSFWDIFY